MKQELYINGQRADIKEDSLILFTYQQSDYSDPTAVKNSYTKSVTLPGTPNNHRIFNNIYRLDYNQMENMFNPSKRTQFEIISNGTLLEQGYIKLTKITGQGEYREYQISLYGGLGDFMYSLQYTAEGNKISLYDIISYDHWDLDFRINRHTVKDAWDYINGDRDDEYSNWSLINFAPCYNGIPESDKFDAKKIALYCGSNENTIFSPVFIPTYSNGTEMNSLPYKDGDYKPYCDKNNHWWSLIEVGDDMDEWQMGDHRSWLQRPIFSVKFLFKAIELYLRESVDPKFEMILDDTWFNNSNPYWSEMWITLPLLYENKEDVKSGDGIDHKILFGNTKTPYEYLTSYTKSFGLWYDYDTTTRKVKIAPRYKFYSTDVKDITDKIDMSNVKIDPLSFSYRTLKYEWKEGEDNISEDYKKKTGENYGVYGIDTGWAFDNSSKIVPQNQIMKSAVDIRDSGIYYSTLLMGMGQGTGNYQIMPSWMWANDMKYYLYNKTNPEDTKEYDNIKPSLNPVEGPDVLCTCFYMDDELKWEYRKDGVAKPNFCDNENKTVDGSDVFLLYTGKDTSPRWYKASSNTSYNLIPIQQQRYLTDDVDGFDRVNDDKHCWINTTCRTGYYNLPYVTSTILPQFNRMDLTNKNVDWSLDFGKPAQTYVYRDLVYPESSSISRKTFLNRYISDLYDVNTRLVETKMRIEDPYTAMRTVYYFSNSLWVINKMTDFNYETNLTTVQFIKVNDIDNYIIKMPQFDYGFDEKYPINASGSKMVRKYLNASYSDKVLQYNYISDYPWLSGKSGFDAGLPYIQVDWEDNLNFNPRKGYLTMNYGTYFQDVWVNQAGILTPTPKTFNFDNTAQGDYVNFNTKIDPNVFNFTINPTASWMRAVLEDDGKVAVYVDANTTGVDRTGTIIFSYRYTNYITINQSK